MTKSELQEELKQSMLARDELKTSVLRMFLSAIGYYEIQKGGAGYKATEDDVMTVLQREIKQRNDSIEQFSKGNRQDLVDKEKKELEILKSYMPEQMVEEKVREIVEQTIQEVGAKSLQDMGKIMAALIPKIKGKADGGLVNKIVREKLSQSPRV